MKTNKTNGIYLNIYQLACHISLFIVAMPVVDYYCNWYITLLPFLVVIYRLAQYRRTLNDTCALMLLAFCFTLLQFWGVYRGNDFITWVLNGMIVWLPCLVALYVKQSGGEKFVKKYLQTYIIITTVTSVTTLIGLVRYPTASRELASGTEIHDTTKYTLQNIGGYEHIYTLVVLIPIIIWTIRNTYKAWRTINIGCLLINLFCIFKSQYTIAIIVAIITLLVSFLKKYKKILVTVLAALVILLLIDRGVGVSFFSQVFLYFSKHIGAEYVGDRLLQVSQLLEGAVVSTQTSTARIDHYRHCWQGFINSPIWGNNMGQFAENNISGHSMALDIMAGLGLIGLASTLAIFRKSFEIVFRAVGKKISSTILITWLTFIAVSILNPSSFMTVYMAIFAGCMCIQRLEK